MPQQIKRDRAYSVLNVKSIDEEQRVIRGVATTPTPDRSGDIVVPGGVKFNNPMPLLWQHRTDKPVGTVVFDKATKDGITFEARLPIVTDEGELKDRVDEAWQSVKLGLVTAVSIGFRAIKYAYLETGGIEFSESEVYELSLVTIPANAEATITQIKAIDAGFLGATAQKEKGVVHLKPARDVAKPKTPIKSPVEGSKMTIQEQIASFNDALKTKQARLAEIMKKSGDEGRTLDASESEEFETLSGEVKAVQEHLTRLKSVEGINVETAAPVTAVKTHADAVAARGGEAVIKVASRLEKGVQFARVAKCVGLAGGNLGSALQMAQARYKDDQGIQNVLKAAVAAGTTDVAAWAGNLVGDETRVYADFVEYLRPQTIIGRFGTDGIPALRNIPFRTALIGQTTGGDGYWVGEGAPVPLTKFEYGRTTLEPVKVGNIAVITKELLRSSSPSADMLIRDQLAAALRERLDTDFIDPSKAASAGVSPASITNGLTAITSSGTTADDVRTDVRAVFAAFIAANNAPSSGVWIMSSTTALALSMMTTITGASEFPGISMLGGRFQGLPVIVSDYVPTVSAGSLVILANASDIYLGDEMGLQIDFSTEASLQMLDNPTNNSTGSTTATTMVSMFQTDCVAFKAIREINWSKRRASAVAYVENVLWGV